MDYIEHFFEFCHKNGIEPEFTLLALIGIGVGAMLQLHWRSLTKKHKKTIEILEQMKINQDTFKETLHRVEERNNRNDTQLLSWVAWQESIKEKIDGLHDDMKEIKKSLMFK